MPYTIDKLISKIFFMKYIPGKLWVKGKKIIQKTPNHCKIRERKVSRYSKLLRPCTCSPAALIGIRAAQGVL